MTARDEARGPLDGIRVIDLTSIVLGPLAAQILGDMGADVVKVEPPAGDTLRATGPEPTKGRGAVFMGCNRSKRSLVLDLKQAEGREALLALAGRSDVFLHNMRPKAIERLGLSDAEVRAARPDIIYCAAYGFRAGGPYSDKPAFDDMIQGASGFAALQGRNLGRPTYANSVIADKIVAMAVVSAIAMALFHRLRTGRGQAIEVPMFETLVAFNMVEHLYGQSFEPPRGACGYPRTLSPDRRPYRTADGYIGVLPYTERQWQAFFAVAGRPEMIEDPRFATYAARLANVDALYAALAACLTERSSADWLAALEAAHVPCTAINQPDDLPRDPHLAAVGFWELREDAELGTLRLPGIATRFTESPGAIRRLAPRLGEHSIEVLREAGLSEDRIGRLLAAGVTVQAPPLAAVDTEEVP